MTEPVYRAAVACLIAAATVSIAGAEELNPSQFEVPAKLVKSAKDFCASVAPRKADFVEYVDGYAIECGNSIGNCVNPLFQGYSFLEFERDGKQSFGRYGLPAGLYRAEIVDAPNTKCDTFDAATLGDRLWSSFGELKQKDKCVSLAGIQYFTSAYKFERIRLPTKEQDPEQPMKVARFSDRIIRLSDNAVVAQQIEAYLDISEGASLSCKSPVDEDGLIAAVIPPRVYAPRP